MNRYLTFHSTSFGYQTIARKSHNQTFVWRPLFPGMIYEFKFGMSFKSDLNYQLVVL